MILHAAPNESLLAHLPLPLAQLYRRAHNAKTALERYLTAFYLWEAALKLLASTAIVEYAERGPAAPELAERLKNLARPALGHWWELVRLLVPTLAETGDAHFARLRDRLLGKPTADCPRAAGLDALLREVLENKPGARTTVQFTELFHRLVALRNDEVGHGAAGQRSSAYYERSGPALLAGIAETLGRLDVLAGRCLVHVADVRRLATGEWLVERLNLSGGEVRRLESLTIPEADAARLPRPGRLYLHDPANASWHSLHPLVLFDADAEQVFFLNARVRQRRAEYLCYTSGQVVKRDELGQEQRELLAKVLGGPVDGTAVEEWAALSTAGDPPRVEPASRAGPEASTRTLGEFELLSRLGRGGMGVVYRAWQPSLRRQVALKCLLRSGDPKSEARFAREILALGRVEHPNLVKVFTSGSDGDQWFYAMELIEGTDLAAVCAQFASSTASEVSEDDWTAAVGTAREQQRQQETPLSAELGIESAERTPAVIALSSELRASRSGKAHISRAVEVVRQAAEAAHALHEANVIHRDVKPGNILLTADGGHAVLMDLGLAQLADETEGRLTRTRQFVGTLRYASPEQLVGATLDRRADVYSLGTTLWELLTLRPVFGVTEQTPTPDMILRLQQAEPERVRKHNPRVPRDLEAIVQKCLAKEKERRYATAGDLAADLDRWQRGEPVQAQPPSLGYLLRKKLRRYRVPVTVAAGVLLAAVVGLALSFLQIKAAKDDALNALGREKVAHSLAETREKETNEARTREQEALAKQKVLLSQAARVYCDGSDVEFRNGNLLDSLNWMLRAYRTAKQAEDPLERSYRHLLTGQAQGLERTLVHDGHVSSVAFSPDGRTVLTGSLDKTARLWDAVTGKSLGLPLCHEAPVLTVAFSPDGRTVLTGSRDHLAQLWEAFTGKPIGPPLQHEDSVFAVAFSPDGGTVLTGCGDKTARLWDAATGKPVGPLLRHEGSVYAVAFSPDGRTVLTGCQDKTARLWDAATGKPVGPPLLHESSVSAVAFSPDGRTFLTGGQAESARLWDAVTRQPVAPPLQLQHGDWVVAVAFSPDGRTVLTGCGDKTARLWEVATGKPVGPPLRHEDAVLAVAYSPDGRTILTGSRDKTARLWDVTTEKPLRLPLRREGFTTAVAFSSDGRTVLTGHEDKKLRLWDAASGKLVGAPLQLENEIMAVAIGPDGRTVLTGSKDKTARLWEVATGKPVGPALRHEDSVVAVAYSPDGRTVLTGSDDKTARLWDVTTGKPLGPPLRHEDPVTAVAFSSDGRAVLTGSDDKTARLWDVATGKPLGPPLRHDAPVLAVAFSLEGRTVLTGSEDNMARLWDAATGKRMGPPLRHNSYVNKLAFSPDGLTVLTGCDDNTARLWDVPTGKPLGPPLRHEDRVLAVAFSSGGRTVLTYSWDKTDRLCLWEGVASPAPDNVDRVRAWVHVRTGKAFDEQGVLRQLNQADWLQAWRDLEARGGDWQAKPSGGRWQFIQTEEAAVAKQWFAVEFHLRCLLEDAQNRDEPFPNAERVVELAQEFQKGNLDSTIPPEIVGAALFRAGDYAAAVKRLNAAIENQQKGGTVWTQLFLAMAYHQLGDDATAKDWLHQADAQMKKRQEAKDAIPNWQERFRDQKLRQEAGELLNP